MYNGMASTIAQKAALKKQLASNALAALDMEREQREESVAGINAIDRTSAPRSGYLGERDYITGKNHEGEAAKLRSVVEPKSGEYGVQSSYAGTNFANGGAPSMAAAWRAAGVGGGGGDEGGGDQGPSDNFDYYARQRALEQSQLQNQMLRERAFRESTQDDPGYAKRRGDVAREEAVRNAQAEGRAASEKWMAEAPMRSAQELEENWKRRQLERERGYSDPAVETARIRGESEVRQQIADRQKERAAAMKAFTDLAKQQSTVPAEIPSGEWDDNGGVLGHVSRWAGVSKQKMKANPAWQALNDAMEQARGVLDRSEPGASGNVAGAPQGGGQQGAREMSMEDAQAMADEKGVSIDQILQMAAQYGWTVR